MIVTIDGPAGAGKSSAARLLAARLGYDYLDTGAMYRAVALAATINRIDSTDSAALQSWLKNLNVVAAPGAILLAGADVAARIRTAEITSLSSRLAALPPVRAYLVQRQRQFAAGRNLVSDGRDQGTAVFPDAECKFYLTADRHERARRRQHELALRGETVALETVLAAQDERDRRDAERDVGPMVPAPDAIVIDNTQLSADEVVSRMETAIRRCSSSTR